MEKNNIETLRKYLFDAIRGLKEGSMDVDTAKAMSSVASEISKTAKLEIDYRVKTGKIKKSEYIECDKVNGITKPDYIKRIEA